MSGVGIAHFRNHKKIYALIDNSTYERGVDDGVNLWPKMLPKVELLLKVFIDIDIKIGTSESICRGETRVWN